tara:strand:+ start:1318 stop:1698 length:381 start_codon:yes stop_codon:yes gene_type:complete
MDFNLTIPKVAVLLFFIMFFYSGIRKIPNFIKNTKGLAKKTGLPSPINEMGMIGVIILEILGSLILVYYFWGGKMIPKEVAKYVCLTFLAFLIVVTPLYHPPTKNIIPFLSNITTFGGLLLIYNLI